MTAPMTPERLAQIEVCVAAGDAPTDFHLELVNAVKASWRDADALDELNDMLSNDEWPGASGMEDVNDVVRRVRPVPVANPTPWERH